MFHKDVIYLLNKFSNISIDSTVKERYGLITDCLAIQTNTPQLLLPLRNAAGKRLHSDSGLRFTDTKANTQIYLKRL